MNILKNMVKNSILDAKREYPIALPMNGPEHGVAIITAKNPVKKLWFLEILVKKFDNLSGN